MNIKLAIRVSVFTILSVVISKAHACCQDPVASFSWQSPVYCGDEVTFTCTSTDADSAISSRSWTASGGTPSTGSGRTFKTKWCSTGPKKVTLEVWDSDSSEGCPPDKYDDCEQEVTVLAVQITSVTSDVDEACVGCDIEFTVTTSPADKYGCIEWSAPGGDPSTGSDETFITNWDTPGPKTVRADGCSNFMDKQVTIVEVDKIQYDDPDSGWTDITGTLYVMYGTSVQFKAIPNPSGASWPSGKPVWGGTSGASGTGETTLVTFYSMSSSTSDYKTITAKCGNTVTENIIVYHFVGDFTPSDDFSGRSDIKYGLEEIVALDFIIDPTGVSASQAGGLEWTKTGVGDISSAGNDGTADYDAEENPGNVTFRLTVKSGPSKGKYQWYSKTVVLPSGTRMTRVNPNTVWHWQYYASAGIKLYYWLDPKYVSFKYLTFGEDSCPSTNVSGFYLTCEPWAPPPPPTNSYPNGTQQAGHPQNTFGAILGGNITTGCRVDLPDYASTGAADPYAAGSFTWSIPTQYIDDTSTRNTFGSNQDHVSTFQANGDATQTKGGQPPGSAALNDATSGY